LSVPFARGFKVTGLASNNLGGHFRETNPWFFRKMTKTGFAVDLTRLALAWHRFAQKPVAPAAAVVTLVSVLLLQDSNR